MLRGSLPFSEAEATLPGNCAAAASSSPGTMGTTDSASGAGGVAPVRWCTGSTGAGSGRNCTGAGGRSRASPVAGRGAPWGRGTALAHASPWASFRHKRQGPRTSTQICSTMSELMHGIKVAPISFPELRDTSTSSLGSPAKKAADNASATSAAEWESIKTSTEAPSTSRPKSRRAASLSPPHEIRRSAPISKSTEEDRGFDQGGRQVHRGDIVAWPAPR